jgi:hypothetical protein
MLFDVPFIANWSKIGRRRQRQTDRNTACENNIQVKWDYKIGEKMLVKKMVFSANQKACMTVILGLSQQFIRMEKSGFNTT